MGDSSGSSICPLKKILPPTRRLWLQKNDLWSALIFQEDISRVKWDGEGGVWVILRELWCPSNSGRTKFSNSRGIILRFWDFPGLDEAIGGLGPLVSLAGLQDTASEKVQLSFITTALELLDIFCHIYKPWKSSIPAFCWEQCWRNTWGFYLHDFTHFSISSLVWLCSQLMDEEMEITKD